MTDTLHIRAVEKPVGAAPFDMAVPAEKKLTLSQIVDLALPDLPEGVPVHVTIGGAPVLREYWHCVRPKAGHTIAIRPVAMGGGKNILGVILTIAVLAASSYITAGGAAGLLGKTFFAGGKIGATLLGAGVALAGTALVNVIAPPPSASISGLGGQRQDVSPSLFIDGATNRASPYGVIPRVFGRHRMVPPLAADQYTEIRGSDHYLRGLVTWGYGPVTISDIKIGDTPIGSFDGVSHQNRLGYVSDAGVSLYPKSVNEEGLSIFLNEGDFTNSAGPWFERRSNPDADQLSVDFVFPKGLYRLSWDNEWAAQGVTVIFNIQYRPVSGGAWVSAPNVSVTDTIKSARRINGVWNVARGQYDVRVRMHSAYLEPRTEYSQEHLEDDALAIMYEAYWSALRTITNEDPVSHPGLAKTAFLIKATDQLSGPVDELNGIVTSRMRDYNGSSWGTVRETRNPASHMVEVLTEFRGSGAVQNPYTANARALSDSRIDWPAFEEFHDLCAAKGWTFDHILDYRSSVWRILSLIATAGRASPAISQGKWSVVIDQPQVAAVGTFTPRNSWDFRMERAYPDQPHALRCGFINADSGWQPDERLVYADGYNASNATRIEAVDYPGLTSSSKVWERARFDMAQALLRPAEYSFNVDVENLTVARGDLIEVGHDVLVVGQNYGRIKETTTSGSDVTHIVVDDVATMQAGLTYGLRVRRDDLTSVHIPIVTRQGETDTLELVTPTDISTLGIAVGDMFSFGEFGIETGRYIVTGIEPGPNLTARLVVVDEAPAVHTADQGTIPPFDSLLGQRDFALRPPRPFINDVQSDEAVLQRIAGGALQTRVVIEYGFSSGARTATPVGAEVRMRTTDGEWRRGTVEENRLGVVAISNVEDGQEIELAVRAVDAQGRSGEWSASVVHTVVGKTTPPPDVTTLLVEADNLVWRYPSPPPDMAGFIVRTRPNIGGSIADAVPAHEGIITDTLFPVSALPAGERQVLVYAIDVAGNMSETPALAVFNLGDPIVANVVATQDEKAGGFPGAITGASVEAGNLVANGTTLMWSDEPSALMWPAEPDALMWVSSYAEMRYQFSYAVAAIDVGAKMTVDAEIDGQPWYLEYRTAPGDDWRPWVGELTSEELTYEFLIRTGAGAVRGEITALSVLLDVPDKIEYVNDQSLSAAGSRLSLAESFRSIGNVNVTLQDDAGSAIRIKVLDKNVSGPLIQAYDSSGFGTTDLIDAIVQGY